MGFHTEGFYISCDLFNYMLSTVLPSYVRASHYNIPVRGTHARTIKFLMSKVKLLDLQLKLTISNTLKGSTSRDENSTESFSSCQYPAVRLSVMFFWKKKRACTKLYENVLLIF